MMLNQIIIIIKLRNFRKHEQKKRIGDYFSFSGDGCIWMKFSFLPKTYEAL